jgi:hypothetical protein
LNQRNCEATNLQYKHLEFDGESRRGSTPYDPPHFKVKLGNRKNWQKKMKSDQQLNGEIFTILPRPVF